MSALISRKWKADDWAEYIDDGDIEGIHFTNNYDLPLITDENDGAEFEGHYVYEENDVEGRFKPFVIVNWLNMQMKMTVLDLSITMT